MDLRNCDYYKPNRILLLCLGLWPTQYTRLRQIHSGIICILLISSVAFQFSALVTWEYNIDIVLKILSTTFPCMVAVIKFSTSYVPFRKIYTLMERVQEDWNMLKEDEDDTMILRTYAEYGRFVTISFAILVWSGIVFFLLIQFLPQFLDIVVPLNESRPRPFPALAEYFVDQQRYFYPILFHMISVVVIGMSSILATETLSLTYVQHSCGLFKVASNRLMRAFDEVHMQIAYTEKNNIICRNIARAVQIHRRAIEFSRYFWSTVRSFYVILIVVAVISISVNLFRLYQATLIIKEWSEIAAALLFIVGHFLYVFVGNYFGQKVIDHSIDVFYMSCNTPWYKASCRAQKMLLFILQRSMQTFSFSAASVYTVSMEGFTTLSSMSLTYFTVIYSVRG